MAIAYFSTWTTYGTWLPGDDRGWFDGGRGWREPDLRRAFASKLLLTADALTLTLDQRRLIELVIAEHSSFREWELYAVNCRTNHVHVVVSAGETPLSLPRTQYKAWSTRKLKEQAQVASDPPRLNWWTERGWDVYIDDDKELATVVAYVLEGQ